MDKYFSVSTDNIYNRIIVLENRQLQKHIIEESGHIEIASDPDCIPKTIEDPDHIYESFDRPKRDVYFGKGKHKEYPDEYVKVITDFSGSNQGFVVSAWVQPEVKGGIGRLKYAKTT
jgi:hypothetical protein